METYQKDNLTGENHEGKKANLPLRYLTASSILKDSVYNRGEEKLGEIKDVMIDLNLGKIKYVVLECGGFLGIGEKFFAVPFEMLQVDTDKHAFIFNQNKETLKNAPGFDKEHWPDTNSHDWQQSYSYWGGFMGANSGTEY